jgi:hypothetical protein
MNKVEAMKEKKCVRVRERVVILIHEQLIENYWRAFKNRKKFFDDFAKVSGFDPCVLKNWEKVKRKDLESQKVCEVYCGLITSLTSPFSLPLPFPLPLISLISKGSTWCTWILWRFPSFRYPKHLRHILCYNVNNIIILYNTLTRLFMREKSTTCSIICSRLALCFH